jgi:hypothetical protein
MNNLQLLFQHPHTPRTDAATLFVGPGMVKTGFARQLERENAALRAEVERLRNDVDYNADLVLKERLRAEAAERALAEARAALVLMRDSKKGQP